MIWLEANRSAPMIWQSCDLFQCTNARCGSRVMVLQSPRTPPVPDEPPQCVCGHPLQRVPYGPEDPLRTWTF